MAASGLTPHRQLIITNFKRIKFKLKVEFFFSAMSFKEIIKLKFDQIKKTNNIDELAQHYLNMESGKISSETIMIGKIPF